MTMPTKQKKTTQHGQKWNSVAATNLILILIFVLFIIDDPPKEYFTHLSSIFQEDMQQNNFTFHPTILNNDEGNS